MAMNTEREQQNQSPPPVADSDVPRGITCLSCGYSLEGLERDGVCPECGTPVADSLRKSALGFLERRDANFLSIGLQMTIGSIGLAVLGALTLLIGIVELGVPLCVAAALVWTTGWHAVAAVRAPGFGENGPFVRRLAVAAAWVQALGFLPLAGVLLRAVGIRLVADVHLALLTTVVSIGVTLGCGHWRLTSLCRRGGDENLIQTGMIAGITLAIMLLFVGVIVGGSLAGSSGIELAMVLFAFLATFIAAGTWGAYALALIEAASARAGTEDRAKNNKGRADASDATDVRDGS
jgi:hypothetical protein